MENQKEQEEVAVTVTTRIFVGGLGENVREADMENTFSPLGIVRNIEIIRSHGRSFAYMDFLPSSPKSLSKLFSTYNGCVWKGGRLRLEIAKEHYLLRLKREWAEDAELARRINDGSVVNQSTDTLEPSKPLIHDKMQLRIFFPRLKKVKPLPYTGTGKHKYSFQRIEVPSLPINFCDCEEHRGPIESAKKKQIGSLEDKSCSVNEEEVNLMTSVMNNIFNRRLNLKNPYESTRLAAKGETFNKSIDNSTFDESESDQEADGDNLVMNMVRNGRSKLDPLKKQDQSTISREQEEIFRKRRFSRDGPTQTKLKVQKGNGLFLFNSSDSSPRQQLPSDRSKRDEIVSSEPKRKEELKTLSKEANGLKRAQSSEQKASIHQSGDPSWRQKSSWKELVGEMNNNSFNISNILQGTRANDLPKSNGLDTVCFVNSTNQNLVKQFASEPIVECSEPFGTGKDEVLYSEVIDGSILSTSKTSCKDSVDPKDVEPFEQKTISHQKAGDISWTQKSSWKELVGDMDSSSFSIANILPTARNLPKSNSSDIVNSTYSKKLGRLESELTGGTCKDFSVGKNGNLLYKLTAPSGSNLEPSAVEEQNSAVMGGLHSKLESNSWNKKDDMLSNGKSSENKSHMRSNKKSTVEPGVVEFCPFMRSAASEREWMKTRATLSGALKKKSNEK